MSLSTKRQSHKITNTSFVKLSTKLVIKHEHKVLNKVSSPRMLKVCEVSSFSIEFHFNLGNISAVCPAAFFGETIKAIKHNLGFF